MTVDNFMMVLDLIKYVILFFAIMFGAIYLIVAINNKLNEVKK